MAAVDAFSEYSMSTVEGLSVDLNCIVSICPTMFWMASPILMFCL